MADDDLEAIRAKRMAELQQQFGVYEIYLVTSNFFLSILSLILNESLLLVVDVLYLVRSLYKLGPVYNKCGAIVRSQPFIS